MNLFAYSWWDSSVLSYSSTANQTKFFALHQQFCTGTWTCTQGSFNHFFLTLNSPTLHCAITSTKPLCYKNQKLLGFCLHMNSQRQLARVNAINLVFLKLPWNLHEHCSSLPRHRHKNIHSYSRDLNEFGTERVRTKKKSDWCYLT